MRKNKAMRLASMLLVLTLLSTCAISGTFAKYVTTGKASDTARVADFGVVITTSGTLFSDSYLAASTDTPAPADWATTPAATGTGAITVNAKAKDVNIVAPGTKSADSGLTFGISGTPEVATKVTGTIKARDIYLAKDYTYAIMTKIDTITAENLAKNQGSNVYYADTNQTVPGLHHLQVTDTYPGTFNNQTFYVISGEVKVDNDYYPVEYALTGTTNNTAATTKKATDVAKLIAEAAYGKGVTGTLDATTGVTTFTFEDDATVYPANTNLADAGPKLGNEKLTWKWEFEDDADGTRDLRDTILGDMIADEGRDDYLVVYKLGDDYIPVTYDTTNKLVMANNVVVASLQTSFDIDLTVTQVD